MNRSIRRRRPKRLHFALLLFLSYLSFLCALIMEQTFDWTNHYDGFMNGLLQGSFFGILWCLMFVLPWGLILIKLNRWRGDQQSPTWSIMAPSILVVIYAIVSLLINPLDPAKRFKNFSNTELPSNAQDLNYRFTGGGIVDYSDTYYFKTTPEEVDRLIADLKLNEDPAFAVNRMTDYYFSPLPDSPDFSSWVGGKVFHGMDEIKNWYYYLLIDSTRTQVYLMIGCT